MSTSSENGLPTGDGVVLTSGSSGSGGIVTPDVLPARTDSSEGFLSCNITLTINRSSVMCRTGQIGWDWQLAMKWPVVRLSIFVCSCRVAYHRICSEAGEKYVPIIPQSTVLSCCDTVSCGLNPKLSSPLFWPCLACSYHDTVSPYTVSAVASLSTMSPLLSDASTAFDASYPFAVFDVPFVREVESALSDIAT